MWGWDYRGNKPERFSPGAGSGVLLTATHVTAASGHPPCACQVEQVRQSLTRTCSLRCTALHRRQNTAIAGRRLIARLYLTLTRPRPNPPNKPPAVKPGRDGRSDWPPRLPTVALMTRSSPDRPMSRCGNDAAQRGGAGQGRQTGHQTPSAGHPVTRPLARSPQAQFGEQDFRWQTGRQAIASRSAQAKDPVLAPVTS
jgi:hypothetical protein